MITLTKYALEDMNQQLNRIEKSLNLLNDEWIWKRVKDGMNSIGNLCLHLAGNEYQNFVSGIEGRPFIRERSREFTTDGGLSGAELINLLRKVRSESEEVLFPLTEDDLTREITIRYGQKDWNRMIRTKDSQQEPAETKRIGQLLVRVAAHYGYHAGQIVLLAKLQQDTDEHISGLYH